MSSACRLRWLSMQFRPRWFDAGEADKLGLECCVRHQWQSVDSLAGDAIPYEVEGIIRCWRCCETQVAAAIRSGILQLPRSMFSPRPLESGLNTNAQTEATCR